MSIVREAIRERLRWRGFVRNRDIVKDTGAARQSVAEVLRAMVQSGEVRMEGCGRGVRYVAGPGCEHGELAPLRGAKPDRFWFELGSSFGALAYIALASMPGRQFRTRAQARRVVEGLEDRRFFIIDLAGVSSLGFAFIHELLTVFHEEWDHHMLTINAFPEVQRELDAYRCYAAVKPQTEYGT